MLGAVKDRVAFYVGIKGYSLRERLELLLKPVTA